MSKGISSRTKLYTFNCITCGKEKTIKLILSMSHRTPKYCGWKCAYTGPSHKAWRQRRIDMYIEYMRGNSSFSEMARVYGISPSVVTKLVKRGKREYEEQLREKNKGVDNSNSGMLE
jgi:hypothetical protein